MSPEMLLSLLPIVAVTLAYPQADSNGLRPSTEPPPIQTTSTLKLEDITTDAADNFTNIEDKDCTCVPSDSCEDENVLYDFFYPSDRSCENFYDVCCKNQKLEVPVVGKVGKIKRGCGYRNPQGTEPSPSGNSKNSGESPWVVALMVGNTTVGLGALVHPQVVLTAAHVAFNHLNNTFKVRAGEWHTQTDKQRLKPQERGVNKTKIHQGFVKANLRNDIALLYLQTPMKLAENIDVVCLPDQDEDFDQSRGCIANGWAKDSSGALTLKKVEADILPSQLCIAKLKSTRLGRWFQLHKSFQCAEEKKDYNCKGDGGAPLVCPAAEFYKVSGLVAWGIGCGDDIPAVYVRVSIFREWIDDSMREWGFGAEEWV